MNDNHRILEAYEDFALTYIAAGWEPFLLTFLFDEFGRSEFITAKIMDDAVEHCYRAMLPYVVRKPRSEKNRDKLPVWIVAPDWQVPKHERNSLAAIAPNHGAHRHAIALMPPISRMKTSLADHIDSCQFLYSGQGRPVARLHAKAIEFTPRNAVGYGLKSVARKRASVGEIWVLPRSRSELEDRRSM